MKALRALKQLLHSPYYQLRALLQPELRRFITLRRKATGMCAPATYRHMYQSVLPLDDLDIVEVGGGAGASGIALALGMQDSGKQSKLIVVEKCEGGSRARFGDYQQNLSILETNFRTFGVEDRIRLFPDYLTLENGDEVRKLISTPQIAGFVHDADGRIDRDFQLLWSLVVPDGLIIIDDCEDKSEFTQISESRPDGGTKKLITYRLVELFQRWGLLEVDFVFRGTVFAHKPSNGDFSSFDPAVCDEVIAKVEEERRTALAAAS